MSPNTPSAIDSGSIARSALASSIDETYTWLPRSGFSFVELDLDGRHVLLPCTRRRPAVVSALQHAVSRRVERGGEEGEVRAHRIDVILYDRVVVLADADHFDRHREVRVRPVLVAARAGRGFLCVGVEAEVKDRAEMSAEQLRDRRRHEHLVRRDRIDHPARGDREAVLVDVQPLTLPMVPISKLAGADFGGVNSLPSAAAERVVDRAGRSRRVATCGR